MKYIPSPTVLSTSFFIVHILSVPLFSLPYYIIPSSIDHLHTYKRLELSSLLLYSNFMLIKF